MPGIPVLPIVAGAAIVLVPPVRRRTIATAGAFTTAGAAVLVASVRGAGDVARAAVTGQPRHAAPSAP